MPCKQCGLSYRNSVHRNSNRFGFHSYLAPDDPALPDRFERTRMALQEVTDPETRHALETLLEELDAV